MIDDVWICQRVPGDVTLDLPADGDRVKRTLTRDPRSGRQVETVITHRGFTTMFVTADTRTVAARLSVPRMTGNFHNFPLRELPVGVEDMNLEAPAEFLSEVTGWTTFPGLPTWPVNKVAFGLDGFVGHGNVTSTQGALAAIRRAYSSAASGWWDRDKNLTGVQFGGQDHCVIFYDKAESGNFFGVTTPTTGGASSNGKRSPTGRAATSGSRSGFAAPRRQGGSLGCLQDCCRRRA